MVAAWDGPDCPLVSDPHARITAENAAHIATPARALVDEVRNVTSSLHRLRPRSSARRSAAAGRGSRSEPPLAHDQSASRP